jgi:transposase
MTVPGIGPIISSAMVAAIGTGDAFAKGRDFGTWLGLVPKQLSTGDRTILESISKRGNRYLRSLFVQAAWVGQPGTRQSLPVNGFDFAGSGRSCSSTGQH